VAGQQAHGRREGEGLTEPAEDAYAEGPGYVAGALAGGLAIGLPGAFLNCCCFVWGPLGGAIAAWMAARRAVWFGWQEGVTAGACAGALGWLVQALIAVPLQLLVHKVVQSNPALLDGLPPMMRQVYLEPVAVAPLVVTHVVFLVVYLGSGAFGGALAGQFLVRKEPRV
jgi:hypothetical protein